ncbi:extracellular solute-binding protein [Acetobacteraceae bacterium H6797]|nr:extracellular solute-binding protein [Acetobacteraceae bacterium H6797]
MRRLPLAAAALLMLTTLAGAQTAAQTPGASRTKLVVYTALENEQLAPLKAAAEAALKDIDIAWVRDSTGIITARLIAERQNPRADLIWGLSVFSMLQMEKLGMLEGYTPVGAAALRPNMRSERRPMTWAGMDAFVAAICFNTILASRLGLPRPETWADLLKPAYRGLIAMPNPASSGTGFLTIAGWMSGMGPQAAWDYMDRLDANIAVYSHSGSAPCNNAARGEYAIGLSFDMRAVTLRNQGGPLDIVVPSDGVGYDLEAVAIPRGAPHPSAARRLADFAVGPVAMAEYGRFYALLALPGIAPSVPNYPPEFSQRLVALDYRAIANDRDAIIREWMRRFDGRPARGR